MKTRKPCISDFYDMIMGNRGRPAASTLAGRTARRPHKKEGYVAMENYIPRPMRLIISVMGAIFNIEPATQKVAHGFIV